MPARLSLGASELPLELWPSVSEDAIAEGAIEKFNAKKNAVTLYFRGVPTKSIVDRTGISRTDLPRLARKCLQLAEDGRIFGFRALIPNIRVSPYTRTAESAKKLPGGRGGLSGVLAQTLKQFENVEDDLKAYIKQDAKSFQIPEKKLRPKDFHRLFLRYLKDRGVKESAWPFNTRYLGTRSIQKYMAGVLARNFSGTVEKREEKEARAHLRVGTGHETFLRFQEPYDAVEIDAYQIENHTCVSFYTPEKTLVELLLERLWLIAAIDRESTAVLAYRIVYRSEVTADDVVALIRDAVTKRWEPQELTIPGLKYPAQGGLPSGVISSAYGAVWSVTLFDGALAHLAEKVRERVRKIIGFVINWGAPGHFERRPNVERTFRQLGQELYRRLPSTTGSHPHNGRADHAEEKAVFHKIRADDVEQLTDVTIAQHNASPCEGISFLTPLEFMRQFLEGHDGRSEARRLPMDAHDSASKFACREKKSVRGSIAAGRRPYVQIDRVHYTNPVLAEAGDLIGRMLIIEIDEDDMRQVRAYLDNGAELGYLRAQGRWSHTKHSRSTRKAINSLIARRILVLSEFDDPVQVFLTHLSTSTKATGRAAQAIPPSRATDATRIAREAGVEPVLRPPKVAQISDVPSVTEVAQRKGVFETFKPATRMAKNRR
jgi:putative transposase